MLSRNRRNFWLVVIIVTPILAIWGYLGTLVPVKKAPQKINNNAYDFYIEQPRIQNWTRDGKLEGEWQAKRLEHIPDQQENHLTQPSGIIHNPSGKVYKIHAKTGTLPDDQSQIVLAGDVEVNHNPPSGQLQKLTTPTLTYYPERRLATTKEKAVYTQGGVTQTSAKGANFYFDKHLIELKSDVRGTYNVQAR